MNTQNKSASLYVAYFIKSLWTLVALSLVVVAVTLSVLRYSLPYMNDQKHHLEQWLSTQIGAQLKIGEINAKWQGVGPIFILRDVELIQTTQSPVSLTINETAIEVDFWQSLLAKQVQANRFDLHEMALTIDLATLGQKETKFPIVEALEKLFLQQLQLFSINDSKIVINRKNKEQQVVLIDQASWFNKDQHHQGVGQLRIEEIAKNSASFVLDLYGGIEQLHGTFFAQGEEVDLSPWVQQLVASKHKLIESRGSFVMWADIKDKSLQSVQLDLSNSRFAWESPNSVAPDEPLLARILGGQINASPIDNEWVFNLNNLTMQINDNVLVSNWQGKVNHDGALSLQHERPLKLAPLIPLLELGMAHEQMQMVNQLQPEATLNSLYVSRMPKGELAIKASVGDIQWQQTKSIPGIKGLTTDFNWLNGLGRLSLKGKSAQLSIDNILPANIDYQRLYADLYIQTSEQGFSISTDNSLFKSELITLQPSFHYRSVDNHLAIAANIETIDVPSLESLYPSKTMGRETRDFLVGALQAGQINDTKILWHGQIPHFPFKQNQGVFQAQLNVTKAQLKFAPKWPALTDLNVDLLFENSGLTMTSHKGQLMDVSLANLTAHIPKLTASAVLSIDANAQAKGQQVTELIAQSSLADTLGKTLDQVQVRGALTTKLHLDIPLNGDLLTAKGQLFLDNNQVTLPSLKILLEQATGEVSFVNEQIEITGIEGLLLEQPITLGFSGDQQSVGYQANINIQGDWQASPLLESFAPGLTKYLSGNSKWSANIDLTLPKKGYQYSATIVSDLEQIDSTLPAPFAKTKTGSLPLVLTSNGNQQASSIKILLGDEVEFSGNLPHQELQFSRAHLAIGPSELVGMGLGFSVSVNLPELDSTPWYAAINALVNGVPRSNKPLLQAPKRIFVNVDNAIVASQRLTDFEMVAKNTNDSWLLDINAKQTRMEMVLYKDWLNQGIKINADFIDIAKWQSPKAEADGTENTDKLEFVADIDTLPPIDFACNHCRILDNDLGKIDFSLSRAATGMKIDSLRFNNSHGLFYGSGDWFLVDGQSSTRLVGEFSSSNFGSFLEGFKFNSGIKDSKASSKFDLSWQSAPYEFNFETLNGEIDWNLSDGYLTEVDDKGSRIFSLLSLDSLVRKLQLDFRDMFAKGFFYDKIKGSFQLENGVAYTQDTSVDGGAGEITMQGYTDLSAKQLNYQIEFVPNVTSSLPVIVAWMINPATALAALALDQVLTSAKVISNIKFSLTGPLAEPVLKELGRNSKEVALPARAKPVGEEAPSNQLIDQELEMPIDIDVPDEEPISD